MKKITLFAFLFVSLCASAQDTYAIYTESTTVGEGLSFLRFSNGQGFTASEATTAPYEGTKSYLLSFNGTSSYFHGLFIPRNDDNTADMSIDISAYSYYNIAIKTASVAPFYIRMRGNGVTAKVLISPTANAYGFSNDNEWHLLSIPIVDFVPESSAFSLTSITEALVIRSNIEGTVAGTVNDFEIDNVYASTEQLSLNTTTKPVFSLYPNPASGVINITAKDSIEKIIINNILGQNVIEMAPHAITASVDISGLQNGIYTVTALSHGKTTTQKLVKK